MTSLAPRTLPVPDRWTLHSYYSLCPYAPDGSGRLLLAGADPSANQAEIFVLDAERRLVDRWGGLPVTPSFWHTGLWQSWSHDGRHVFYQSGSLERPRVTRRELATGATIEVDGDLEGAPPGDGSAPLWSCSHGLLYAAGYGDHVYRPEQAPVPFQARDRHGVSRLSFDPPGECLALTTAEILERHPHRDRLHALDRDVRARYGPDDGLTLMTYALRWNRTGTRCLFFFGNHTVARVREEPRLGYIFTADRDLRELHLAVDCSAPRRGVHWSWQADPDRLIGYGPDPAAPDSGRTCLAEVRFDGTGYRKLSPHASGGHPSTSPLDPDLIVTDEPTPTGGAVVFLSRRTGTEVARVALPKFLGDRESPGRHSRRICHHPVFDWTGTRVLANTLPGPCAVPVEIVPPGVSTG